MKYKSFSYLARLVCLHLTSIRHHSIAIIVSRRNSGQILCTTI